MNALCFNQPLLSVINMLGVDFYLDAGHNKLYIILYNTGGIK